EQTERCLETDGGKEDVYEAAEVGAVFDQARGENERDKAVRLGTQLPQRVQIVASGDHAVELCADHDQSEERISGDERPPRPQQAAGGYGLTTRDQAQGEQQDLRQRDGAA